MLKYELCCGVLLLSMGYMLVFHKNALLNVQIGSISGTLASKGKRGNIMSHLRSGMNRPKFKSLVHYVIARRCDLPETLGAVKLNKVLWQ